MQGARYDFINGKQDVKVAEKRSVECIVLLTLWFIILSCLGRCNKRPLNNILYVTVLKYIFQVSVLYWSSFILSNFYFYFTTFQSIISYFLLHYIS